MRVVREFLNSAHYECASQDAEIFMHQQSDDIIVVTRQFPLTKPHFDAYVTVVRFCYSGSN